MILGSILDITAKAINKVASILKHGGKARVLDDDEDVGETEIFYQGIAIEVPDEIAKESIKLDENLSDETLAMVVTHTIQDVDKKTQEWEPPDVSIDFTGDPYVKRAVVNENPVFPDGWSVAYYPAGGNSKKKPNIQAIREWVQNVKLSNLSNEEVSLEYSRILAKPVPSKLNKSVRDSLIDSITFMVARKIWYVGRRSADFTDHEWNEETKHMRPPQGSFSKNEKWTTTPFPYGEEYVYTSGDVHRMMIDFKETGSLKY